MLLEHKARTPAPTSPQSFVFATRTGRPLHQTAVFRALYRAQERARDARGLPTFPELIVRDESGQLVVGADGDFVLAKVKRRELRLPNFHALRHGAAMDCDDAEEARTCCAPGTRTSRARSIARISTIVGASCYAHAWKPGWKRAVKWKRGPRLIAPVAIPLRSKASGVCCTRRGRSPGPHARRRWIETSRAHEPKRPLLPSFCFFRGRSPPSCRRLMEALWKQTGGPKCGCVARSTSVGRLPPAFLRGPSAQPARSPGGGASRSCALCSEQRGRGLLLGVLVVVSQPGAGGERSEPPLMIVKNILTAYQCESLPGANISESRTPPVPPSKT
jgi:hypothetical protein